MESFLAVCAAHDFRRDISSLDGASAAMELRRLVLAEMEQAAAILPATKLAEMISAQVGHAGGASGSGVDWLIDHLLVLQVGAAVRGLADQRYPQFDTGSVPDVVFWRKNAGID